MFASYPISIHVILCTCNRTTSNQSVALFYVNKSYYDSNLEIMAQNYIEALVLHRVCSLQANNLKQKRNYFTFAKYQTTGTDGYLYHLLGDR